MDFTEMIAGIMPEVESGGDAPLLIYRDADGGWHGDFTRNQFGETFDWVADVIELDKAAFVTRGLDFAGGSMSYVHDKVLCCRLSNEYHHVWSYDRIAEHKKVYALLNFFEDNVGVFSRQVTDYLASVKSPLKALVEMCPFNMATGREGRTFNEDLAPDAIDKIEYAVDGRLNNRSLERVPEIKTADGHKVIASVDIGGVRTALTDNPADPDSYVVYEYSRNNYFGIEELKYRVAYNDYVDAVFRFNNSMMVQVEALRTERNERKLDGVEMYTLTASDCVPNGLDEDISGKLIIIKPEVLSPEFRSNDYQLRIAENGFGCAPEARGTAVFCTDLYSGNQSRFERYDILGVADLEKLPEWAKKKVALRKALKEPGVFKYGGYHFIPERKFEKRDGDFGKQMNNASSDRSLGIAAYNWGKTNYSHAAFYSASGDSQADIFRCVENGKLYIPCENELFRYDEPPPKKQTAQKPKQPTTLLGALRETTAIVEQRKAERANAPKNKTTKRDGIDI